ncbi:MFS transporter [Maridesulfovibrio salexigens]|uniref:Major facilitator superfamily MFS_1 n=1 Tax=Maridesulfovibrio salexigens (strain ATCC 14822 / DSM 2638 / NCIMB 8403 / VKM B-1763) TaxID=526222 RepID=C6BSK6_MARSD|nr:MFS transporter [Maridesulfovibrio salexigens]ACS81462.1 major facilitator superfamily MFS_1 [Maridesulfovibrio salexigens DSM 2638]
MPTKSFTSRKMYIFLLVLTIATTVGFQGWRTLLNNFAVEVAGLDGGQFGLLGSIREIPGFLALLVIYVLMFIKEHRLAALSVIIMGLGICITGFMPSFAGLAFTTLVMSFGFHYYETLNQSLTLQYFGYTEAPLVMGRLRSLAAATNICVGVVVISISGFMGYSEIFFGAGIVAVLAGLYCLTRDPSSPDLPPQHKKMIFRSKYWLFYALTFIAGARRQIFVAFAVFLLVKKFGFSLQHIAILFVVNNVINYFVNPIIAKSVNKFGERKVLTLEYASLFLIFTAYAYTDSPLVGALLYILDNIFFNFTMAIKTFFQKIADKPDIAPSMAVSFTINHIAAVFVPVLGGIAWMQDYRIVFLGAAGMSLVSLVLSQFVDRELLLKGRTD